MSWGVTGSIFIKKKTERKLMNQLPMKLLALVALTTRQPLRPEVFTKISQISIYISLYRTKQSCVSEK